jgi:hypothetical protein
LVIVVDEVIMSSISLGYRKLAAQCEQLMQQAVEERYKSVLRRAAAKLKHLADQAGDKRIRSTLLAKHGRVISSD